MGEKWFYDQTRFNIQGQNRIQTVTFKTGEGAGPCDKSVTVPVSKGERYLVLIADYKFQNPDPTKHVIVLSREKWVGQKILVSVLERGSPSSVASDFPKKTPWSSGEGCSFGPTTSDGGTLSREALQRGSGIQPFLYGLQSLDVRRTSSNVFRSRRLLKLKDGTASRLHAGSPRSFKNELDKASGRITGFSASRSCARRLRTPSPRRGPAGVDRRYVAENAESSANSGGIPTGRREALQLQALLRRREPGRADASRSPSSSGRLGRNFPVLSREFILSDQLGAADDPEALMTASEPHRGQHRTSGRRLAGR
jgi:hypothetical protein